MKLFDLIFRRNNRPGPEDERYEDSFAPLPEPAPYIRVNALGQLEPPTLLNARYRIVRVLGQGGGGITYLATDEKTGRKVAVKEFFLKDYCDRTGTTSEVVTGVRGNEKMVAGLRRKFVKEAGFLSGLRHPGVVRNSGVFEQGGTAYYVMDYIEGESLLGMVRSEGPLSMERGVRYVVLAGMALEYVHGKNIAHLDVKPANIMVRRSDDRPMLIDFGIAKHYDEEGRQTTMSQTGRSEGYSPIELYGEGDGVADFSPSTDIYSLGATLYYVLSDVRPPKANQLINDDLVFPASVPAELIPVITKAMSPARRDRYQTMRDFLIALCPDYESLYQIDDTEIPPEDGLSERDAILERLINNMVYVEGGSFMMGSDDSDAYNDEKPVHRETVGSFSIGKYEVTRKEWHAVMEDNPDLPEEDRPMTWVSWNDCQKFIQKLNSLSGRNFRLPTEAEWEYASKGGNRSKGYKYSGSNDINSVAWQDGNCKGTDHKVGSKEPNELGLYDMSGNAWELTSSKWCDDYSKPSDSSVFVIRGGSWDSAARDCRVSRRGGAAGNPYDIGFRLAL